MLHIADQKAHISLLQICFCLNFLRARFLMYSGSKILYYFVFERSFEKFLAQNVVDFDKCYVRVKNVVVYVDFADIVVVVVEHLTFVISPMFFLDFPLTYLNLEL